MPHIDPQRESLDMDVRIAQLETSISGLAPAHERLKAAQEALTKHQATLDHRRAHLDRARQSYTDAETKYHKAAAQLQQIKAEIAAGPAAPSTPVSTEEQSSALRQASQLLTQLANTPSNTWVRLIHSPMSASGTF